MSSLTAARMSYAAALVASVTFGQWSHNFVLRKLDMVALGVYISVAAHTTYKVLRRRRMQNSASTALLLIWIASTFVAQIIYYVAGSQWSELEFVETTEDPGIFAGQLSSRLAILKDTAYTVAIWLADAFIVWQ